MSISGRKNIASSRQGIHDHVQHTQAQVMEDDIRLTTGASVKVHIGEQQVTLSTFDYTDFLLAKSAIKGSVSLPIVRAGIHENINANPHRH